MLQEISLLKRSRQTVEGLDEQQEAIDKERAIYNELRKNIDDSESKKLSEQYEKVNAELKKIQNEQAQARETRNKLYDERTRIKGLLDEEYNKLRSLRDEHRKANDEYYTFLRELREYKKELERQRRLQQEAEKRQEAARKELELASIPAFEHEITLCDNLANFLHSFLGGNTPAQSANANDEKAAGGRAPDASNAPEGVALLKKSEREEDYFVGSNKKKGGKGANKEKKTDTLKLPLATMEGFFEVKVTVPTKISDIPSTLEKLKERKEQYLAEQPKVTEANKKKAEEKIAAMLKEEEEKAKAKAAAGNANANTEKENSEPAADAAEPTKETTTTAATAEN